MFKIINNAWKELVSYKTRSLLTALGIMVGVMAVTMIVASGTIAQTYLTNQLTGAIGNTKTIQVDTDDSRDLGSVVMDNDDFIYIKSREGALPFGKTLPTYLYSVKVENSLQEQINQSITGTIAEYADVNTLSNFEGRFFNTNDIDSNQNVIVISRSFAKNVKGVSTLLGETVKLDERTFEVVGEYDSKSSLGSSTEVVFMPITTLWSIDGISEQTVNYISFQADKENQVDYVTRELKNDVNTYRAAQFSGSKSKPLSFETSASALSTVSSILTAFQLFLGLVAFISLVVGGIGVLNVMLMSVNQRVREIGIRRAFGAKNWDIAALFLSESTILTVLSGLFGASFAQYFLILFVKLSQVLFPDLNLVFQYSWSSMTIALFFSFVLGILFGLYPAIQASKMSIVESLRYD